MFEVTGQKILYSQCDDAGLLPITGIINYFQDCSGAHSDYLGVGHDFYSANNGVWILDFWQIIINRRPKHNENIVTATWPHSFKGFFGMRNFTMRNDKNEMLAYANSYWVYMDAKEARPVKVTEDIVAAYGLEKPLDMEYANRKLVAPSDMEFLGTETVRKHHLDINRHMNNGRYVEMAYDYADCLEVSQIRCQYKKQAMLGNVIHIYRKRMDNSIYISLRDEGGKEYATVCFDVDNE